MKGRGSNQKLDWIDSFDPRVTGLAAQRGTVFRYIPPVGVPEILIKEDSGFSQLWSGLQIQSASTYFVGPGQKYATIQSAIDAAYAAGSGMPGIFVTIFIAPGVYNENLTFRPGQALKGLSTAISLGAITIYGQHVYAPPAGGNILDKVLACEGLSFYDTLAGNTLTLNFTNEGFASFSGCVFAKESLTGNMFRCLNPGGIVAISNASSISHQSSDPFIYSEANVTVCNNSSYQNGSPGPFIDYQGAGTLVCTLNTVLINAPYIVRFGSGNGFMQLNFFNTLLADSDGVRVAAGASTFFVNSTLNVPAGAGYIFQGTGTVNGAMIVYGGGNNTKDPGLTFNLLPSDP